MIFKSKVWPEVPVTMPQYWLVPEPSDDLKEVHLDGENYNVIETEEYGFLTGENGYVLGIKNKQSGESMITALFAFGSRRSEFGKYLECM